MCDGCGDKKAKDPAPPKAYGPDTAPARSPVAKCPAKPNCVHPTGCSATRIPGKRNFGIDVTISWQASPSGGDMSHCWVTEYLIYSVIPNPPFRTPSGGTIPQSGATLRLGKLSQAIPDKPSNKQLDQCIEASALGMDDQHEVRRDHVEAAPTAAGRIDVKQSYDYYCTRCMCGWTPFGYYAISHAVYQNEGKWKVQTYIIGAGGPFKEDEDI
jgi:hypothetical protein